MNVVRILANSRPILRMCRFVVRLTQHANSEKLQPQACHTLPHTPTTKPTPSHLQVHTLGRLVQVLGHQLLEANQAVLQPLLEELGEKVARQQQFVVRQRIGVVVAARTVRLGGGRRFRV